MRRRRRRRRPPGCAAPGLNVTGAAMRRGVLPAPIQAVAGSDICDLVRMRGGVRVATT